MQKEAAPRRLKETLKKAIDEDAFRLLWGRLGYWLWGWMKGGTRQAAHLRPWLAWSTINSNTLSHFALNKARS